MPRKAPTQVIEQRLTFGTFERQWVVEQEEYLKTRLNIASVGLIAVPIGAVLGGCALGYGAYAGMCAIAGAIPFRPSIANAKVHFNRLTDPEWWKNPFGYEDKPPN